MNATQALSRLRKALGKDAIIQDSKTPSSPEAREAARAARCEANERRRACEAAMNERRDAVLAADAEYQRLRQEYEAARKAQQESPWPHHRYSGGILYTTHLSVKAQADTLDELVETIERQG